MDSEKPSPWKRFTEWFVSHALWEFLVASFGAFVVGVGGARLMHAALDAAVSISLVLVGLLGIAWSVGLLPLRIGRTTITDAYKDHLKRRCFDLLVKWEELGELWMNAAKAQGSPATLQEPMSPVWVSSTLTTWPYKVGELQSATLALREDLRRAQIPLEEWDHRISLPRLKESLREYRIRLGT